MKSPHKAQDHFRVFVVENHEDTLECIVSYLESQGHTVQCATSMTEALEKIPVSDCEILISDISLFDGDGWQLLRQVALPSSTYAVAMTGFGMEADRAKSEAAGFHEHLVKPMTPDVIDESLRRAAAYLAAHRPVVPMGKRSRHSFA